MADMESLLNIVRREVERGIARFQPWSIGTISSYDPATRTAKVQLQPEDTQTGWLPIASQAVGNGFGLNIGPHTGTSCLIHFQGGDREAGIIMGFFFTDDEKPVSVDEGEIVIKTEWGSAVSMLKDGSVLLMDKSGATFGLDGLGNLTVNAKSGASFGMDAAGNLILNPAGAGNVILGGSSGGVAVAKDGDTVTGGIVHATSLKVKVL
jgi:phage gp45-like